MRCCALLITDDLASSLTYFTVIVVWYDGRRKMLQLIDTHAHLDEIENLEEVLGAAREAGLAAIIAVGSDITSNVKTLEIAARYPGFVYPALGWHPWYIKESEIEASLEFIKANIAQAVAIGEVGLDYHKRVRAVAGKGPAEESAHGTAENC